jgi:hypothetical protein
LLNGKQQAGLERPKMDGLQLRWALN